MAGLELLNNFQEINIETPVDKIIKQIRELITTGQLNPGDKLPPERKLAERLGVGRSNVRDAIKKLEFYGILRTLPQSGTVVAGIGITALEGLISDVLMVENSDFKSLIETRVLLEIQSAKFAAERRTDTDIEILKTSLEAYRKKVLQKEPAVEEDLMFHMQIANASKNSVLRSLMLIITPDIIKNYLQLDICKGASFYSSLEEHEDILNHIINQNPDEAAAAMRVHLDDIMTYSQGL